MRAGNDEFEFLPAEEFIRPCSMSFTKAVEIGTEDEEGDEDFDEDDEDFDEEEDEEI